MNTDNLPNKITILRMLSIPPLMYFLLSGQNLWSLVLFLFSSLTDFLDGYLARKNDQVSAFGKFADPIADKILISAVFITMVELNEISAAAVVIIVAREFMVTGLRLIGSTREVVISASWMGKVKTVSQIVLVISILLTRQWEIPLLSDYVYVLVYIVIGTTLISGLDYLVKNRGLIDDVF